MRLRPLLFTCKIFLLETISDDEEVRGDGILSDPVGEAEGVDSNDGGNRDTTDAHDDYEDDDYDNQNSSILELEEQGVLEDLLSVLNTEYGCDDVSDSEFSDCDSDRLIKCQNILWFNVYIFNH